MNITDKVIKELKTSVPRNSKERFEQWVNDVTMTLYAVQECLPFDKMQVDEEEVEQALRDHFEENRKDMRDDRALPAATPGSAGLTEQEKLFLGHLRLAWGVFLKMRRNHSMEAQEMATAIHKAQWLIAGRVAARVNPEVWANCTGGNRDA